MYNRFNFQIKIQKTSKAEKFYHPKEKPSLVMKFQTTLKGKTYGIKIQI